MKISWYMHDEVNGSAFLFYTEGEMPREGDTVSLRDSRGPSSPTTGYKVKRASHTLSMLKIVIENLKLTKETADERLDEVDERVEEIFGKGTKISKFNSMDRSFDLVRQEGEVTLMPSTPWNERDFSLSSEDK